MFSCSLVLVEQMAEGKSNKMRKVRWKCIVAVGAAAEAGPPRMTVYRSHCPWPHLRRD